MNRAVSLLGSLLGRLRGGGSVVKLLTLFVRNSSLEQGEELSLSQRFETLLADLVELLLAGSDTKDDVVGIGELLDDRCAVLLCRFLPGVSAI